MGFVNFIRNCFCLRPHYDFSDNYHSPVLTDISLSGTNITDPPESLETPDPRPTSSIHESVDAITPTPKPKTVYYDAQATLPTIKAVPGEESAPKSLFGPFPLEGSPSSEPESSAPGVVSGGHQPAGTSGAGPKGQGSGVVEEIEMHGHEHGPADGGFF